MTDVVIVQAEPEAPPEPEIIPVPIPVPVEVPPEPEPESVVPVAEPVPDWAGEVVEHRQAIQVLQQQMAMRILNEVAFRGDLDGRAFSEHEHPVDEDLRIIADELKALREEEDGPSRGIESGWLWRWLRGRR